MASLPSWARVGQKVLCITDFAMHRKYFLDVNFPEQGQVYTIGKIAKFQEGYGIYLAEILNDRMWLSNGKFGEPSFDASNFRP